MDKLREEFEADFENETGWSAGEYPSQEVVDLCWRLYQQSRASIVVELPPIKIPSGSDTLLKAAVQMAVEVQTNKCAESIRSIGLSIKGE